MSCGGAQFLLGSEPMQEPLPLTVGADYVRSLSLVYPAGHVQAGQPQPFPPGSLSLRIFTEPVVTVWQWSISGSVASIKVESEDVAKVPDRTRFQLVWLPAGEVAGGQVWVSGKVRVLR